MTDCPRIGRWIGGCNWQGRYDKSPADLSQFESVRSRNPNLAESFRQVTYVRDICTTCGKTIERQK